jgi:hypothetical protein
MARSPYQRAHDIHSPHLPKQRNIREMLDVCHLDWRFGWDDQKPEHIDSFYEQVSFLCAHEQTVNSPLGHPSFARCTRSLLASSATGSQSSWVFKPLTIGRRTVVARQKRQASQLLLLVFIDAVAGVMEEVLGAIAHGKVLGRSRVFRGWPAFVAASGRGRMDGGVQARGGD